MSAKKLPQKENVNNKNQDWVNVDSKDSYTHRKVSNYADRKCLLNSLKQSEFGEIAVCLIAQETALQKVRFNLQLKNIPTSRCPGGHLQLNALQKYDDLPNMVDSQSAENSEDSCCSELPTLRRWKMVSGASPPPRNAHRSRHHPRNDRIPRMPEEHLNAY